MKVEIYDDKFSIGHTLLGILAYFHISFFIIFLFYELIEFCYKYGRKEETPAHFVGDLCEFFIGYSFVSLLLHN